MSAVAPPEAAPGIRATPGPRVTAGAGSRRLPLSVPACVAAVTVALLAVVAVLVRARGLQSGLIYPDGYQYLLMARGIAAHLQPTVALGHGGMLFVPSADAALKPVFPAVVAALSSLGGSPRALAGAVTVAGAASTVVLAALLSRRLSGSNAAAATAGLAALLSPSLARWSGFAGPDPLAAALALATALAALDGRFTLAGLLGAVTIATRPEWLLALAPAAAVGLAGAHTRADAGRALRAAAVTLAVILGVFRPPLRISGGDLLALAAVLAAAIGLQCGAAVAARRAATALAAALAVPALLAIACISGHLPALAELWRAQWPMLMMAVGGAAWAARGPRAGAVLGALAAAAVLVIAYAEKNAGSERYLAELMPFACVAAGCVAATGARGRVFAGLGLAATLVVSPAAPRYAPDDFGSVAARVSASRPGTLITAAPDAYGYLVRDHPVREAASGARGLVLVDAAWRAYEPSLAARGRVLALIPAHSGFLRPDGRIDRQPAVLLDGIVILRRPVGTG